MFWTRKTNLPTIHPFWGPDKMEAYMTPPSGGIRKSHLHLAGSVTTSTAGMKHSLIPLGGGGGASPEVEVEVLI